MLIFDSTVVATAAAALALPAIAPGAIKPRSYIKQEDLNRMRKRLYKNEGVAVINEWLHEVPDMIFNLETLPERASGRGLERP